MKEIIHRKCGKRIEECSCPDAEVSLEETDSEIIEPIQWQKSETDIETLFSVMLERGLISEDQYNKRHILIEQHFVNKEGKPFNF